MGKAVGKYAFGICDRTGFRYPINELVYEFNNGKRTGLRVGRDVADKDMRNYSKVVERYMISYINSQT